VGTETKQTCEFKFTNTGGALLKISEVRPVCVGCTVARLGKREYRPGESGTLKVTYSSSSRPGRERKYVYVSSNDGTRKKVRLTIEAEVMAKVAHEPKELRLLLNRENAGCPQIVLRSLNDQLFAIKQFRSTANSITADYDPSVKRAKFVLAPKVDMGRLKKNLKGRISIGLTHPECETVTIGFKTLPRFLLTPALISILDSRPHETVTRQVWVLNNYDEDFELESVSSKKGIVKVLGREKVGRRYKLVVEIVPPIPEGRTPFFTDELFLSVKGGEKLTVPCRGFYSLEPTGGKADNKGQSGV
jgi:hypothetical protein